MNARGLRSTAAAAAVCVAGFVGGCDEASSEAADAEGEVVRQAEPDATLHTHEIVPSTPTPEGLAYIEAMAKVFRDADAQPEASARRTLRSGLELAVPDGLPEAEILRLQLLVRLARGDLEQGNVDAARDRLQPMLAPSKSLPLDKATAEALIVLGDAAARSGDEALAAGSYARSIRMMSILREELTR